MDKSKNFIIVTALFYLLALKILFLIYGQALPDETYYWLWAKKIDFSFYDHPPLSVWLQSLFSQFITNKQLLIRIVPTLSFIIIIVVIFVWVKALKLHNGLKDYLTYLLLFLSVPVLNIFLTISFPDPLMILMLSLSGLFFFLYLECKNLDKYQYSYWYLTAFFFGLALISKYNAVLFGLGLMSFLAFSKKENNNLLYTKHFLFSILLILLIFSPVVFWNISNDYASFGFHLDKRLNFELSIIDTVKNLVIFMVSILVSFSPILVFNLMKLYQTDRFNEKILLELKPAKHILVVCCLFFFLLFFFVQPLYYWAIPAIVMLLPYLPKIIHSKFHRILHCMFGIILITVLCFNNMIYPLSVHFPKVDRESAIIYGWENISDIIEEEKKVNGLEKILFTDYRLGSLYAFHSQNDAIDVLMEKRETQFDLWRKKERASSSLILVDDDFPLNDKISSLFTEIVFLRKIDVKVMQKTIISYQLYGGFK